MYQLMLYQNKPSCPRFQDRSALTVEIIKHKLNSEKCICLQNTNMQMHLVRANNVHNIILMQPKRVYSSS
jgi:hypothetical protein